MPLVGKGMRHNSNTLLVCRLRLQALLPILFMYAIPTSFKEKIFCCLNRSTVLWGHLPTLTERMMTFLNNVADKLDKIHIDVMLKLLRENNRVVVVQLNFETYIIGQSDFVTMLTSTVSKNISSGFSAVRYVNLAVLKTLFKFDDDIGNVKHQCKTSDGRFVQIDSKEQSHLIGFHAESKVVTFEEPRKINSTNSLKCNQHFDSDDQNQDDLLATVKQEQRLLLVCPLDSHQHHLPESYPTDDDERYPVQATEMDAGKLSISPTASSSLYSTENQRPGNQHVITGTRRGYANISSGIGLQNQFQRARYPNYVLQADRLFSFNTRSWDSLNKPQPAVLAEFGFFFIGNQDLVRCFQCGIGLKDWVKEDDVLMEHVKHSSACSFLVQKLGKERIDQLKNILDSSAEEASASVSAQLPCKIRSPRYQTMGARLASFRNFPGNIHISHSQLAVAGMFYTGNGDLCRCFTCDGGLKDWSTGDDPIKEHATYFPNCTYINQLKGSGYVAEQQRSLHNDQSRGAAAGSSFQETETVGRSMQEVTLQDSSFTVSEIVQKLGYAEIDVITARPELDIKGKPNPTAEEIINAILDIQERTQNAEPDTSRQPPEENLQTIMEENQRLFKMVHCMLCVTKEANTLFLPCTHHRVCQDCSKGVIYCPVCDQLIKEKVKTYRV